jgi:hypothetical protein
MTTPRRRPNAKLRMCAHCGAPISELRPVFLVDLGQEGIVGPYHAGCAARLAMEVQPGRERLPIPGNWYGRMVAAQLPLPDGGKAGE